MLDAGGLAVAERSAALRQLHLVPPLARGVSLNDGGQSKLSGSWFRYLRKSDGFKGRTGLRVRYFK